MIFDELLYEGLLLHLDQNHQFQHHVEGAALLLPGDFDERLKISVFIEFYRLNDFGLRTINILTKFAGDSYHGVYPY